MALSAAPDENSSRCSTEQVESKPSAQDSARSFSREMLREILETLLFTLLIFFLVRSVIQNFKVEGSSMEPNLHTGQYIMVNRLVYFHLDLDLFRRWLPGTESASPQLAYLFHLPRRGDIVVFEYPRDTSRDFIKRVIGLPGETVEIRAGQVLIDGAALHEPYLPASARSQMGNMGPVQVPQDAVFVMGDNRGNSSDSRNWGSLPLNRIVGQAWFTYWPRDYWGLIPHAEPSLAAP
ncbi:MAG: signal peptidase I [Chloroflexia bacterium]|nr:signal peptidase I [Chloroflexia bacterium]